jgi:hypothetical protein
MDVRKPIRHASRKLADGFVSQPRENVLLLAYRRRAEIEQITERSSQFGRNIEADFEDQHTSDGEPCCLPVCRLLQFPAPLPTMASPPPRAVSSVSLRLFSTSSFGH